MLLLSKTKHRINYENDDKTDVQTAICTDNLVYVGSTHSCPYSLDNLGKI